MYISYVQSMEICWIIQYLWSNSHVLRMSSDHSHLHDSGDVVIVCWALLCRAAALAPAAAWAALASQASELFEKVIWTKPSFFGFHPFNVLSGVTKIPNNRLVRYPMLARGGEPCPLAVIHFNFETWTASMTAAAWLFAAKSSHDFFHAAI